MNVFQADRRCAIMFWRLFHDLCEVEYNSNVALCEFSGSMVTGFPLPVVLVKSGFQSSVVKPIKVIALANRNRYRQTNEPITN